VEENVGTRRSKEKPGRKGDLEKRKGKKEKPNPPAQTLSDYVVKMDRNFSKKTARFRLTYSAYNLLPDCF